MDFSLLQKVWSCLCFYVATEFFRVPTKFSMGRIFCRDKGFSVAIELACVERSYVMTEDFIVATENSIAHDRAEVRGLGAQRHALGGRDKGVLSR